MPEQRLYLVTGANGFIASALVRHLVDSGAHVRAAVRRAEVGEALRSSMSPDARGTLEIALVQDITAKRAFQQALQGTTHVFHMASPLPAPGKTDAKRDFLDPALAGTLTLLEDAHLTPSVRKVVLTSSVASILNSQRANTGGSFSEADWNPVTYEQAAFLGEKLQGAAPDAFMRLAMAIYAASKKIAEEAAWEFVRKRQPSFALTAVHPALVVGRPTMGGLSGTNGLLWQMLTTRPVQPDNTTPGYVDLQDVVQGHMAAMETPEADGKRFLLVGGQPMNYQLINWAKDHSNDLPFDRVQVPADAEAFEKNITTFDTRASQEILGIKYKTIQQTVADFVDWVKELNTARV